MAQKIAESGTKKRGMEVGPWCTGKRTKCRGGKNNTTAKKMKGGETAGGSGEGKRRKKVMDADSSTERGEMNGKRQGGRKRVMTRKP